MIGNVNVNSHCVCLTVCWFSSVAGPVLTLQGRTHRTVSISLLFQTKGYKKNAEDSQKSSTGIYIQKDSSADTAQQVNSAVSYSALFYFQVKSSVNGVTATVRLNLRGYFIIPVTLYKLASAFKGVRASN